MHIRCRQVNRMRATRVMANLRVADVEATKSFYTDLCRAKTRNCGLTWAFAPMSAPAVHRLWSAT